MVGHGEGQVGAAHGPAGQAQALERLRAGDLVHEVQVHVEQVGLAGGLPDEVLVPDLLRQRASFGHASVLSSPRAAGVAAG